VVGATAAGELGEGLLHCRHALAGGRRAADRAGLLGAPAAVLDDVQPGHPHAGGGQEPHRQLAHQSQADDARRVAELDLAAPHPVHGDRPHRREGGMLGGHPAGHRGAQIDRDPVVLGMQGVLAACRRDQLAHAELAGPRSHLDHLAAQGVAERGVGVEPAGDLLVGRHRALLRYRVDDLAHLVRPGAGLAHHGQFRLGQLHHLGAGGDEREP
jgi:hypothetical protein